MPAALVAPGPLARLGGAAPTGYELRMHVNEETVRSRRAILRRAGFAAPEVLHREWVHTTFVPGRSARPGSTTEKPRAVSHASCSAPVTSGRGRSDERGAGLSGTAARDWYHTLELAPAWSLPGLVRPSGTCPTRSGCPPPLAGQRSSYVGMFDFFWAFAMERRG